MFTQSQKLLWWCDKSEMEQGYPSLISRAEKITYQLGVNTLTTLPEVSYTWRHEKLTGIVRT